MKTISVLIADDHKIVRMGLKAMFAQEKDIRVVGEAEDGDAALAAARKLRPDVVVMDLMMPGRDGIEATAELAKRLPGTRVVILTSFSTSDGIVRALEAGASGAVLKTSDDNSLLTAIRASSTPLASVGSLSVASGATFDASLVTGGQEIADLTVDAIGGGSLVNVKFAAEGVLRLVNAPSGKLPANYRIPLTFTDAAATGNVANWTLSVNGIPSDRKLGWEDGGLVVLPKGLVVIVK